MEIAIASLLTILGAVAGAAITWTLSYFSKIQDAKLQREQYTFSKFHELQIEAIRILHKQIVLLERAINSSDFYSGHRVTASTPEGVGYFKDMADVFPVDKEMLDKLFEQYKTFRDAYLMNEIFLKPATREKFIGLLNSYLRYVKEGNDYFDKNLQSYRNENKVEFNHFKFQSLHKENFETKVVLFNDIDKLLGSRD